MIKKFLKGKQEKNLTPLNERNSDNDNDDQSLLQEKKMYDENDEIAEKENIKKKGEIVIDSKFDVFIFVVRAWDEPTRKPRVLALACFTLYIALVSSLMVFLTKKMFSVPRTSLTGDAVMIQFILCLFLYIVFVKEIKQGIRLIFVSKWSFIMSFVQISFSVWLFVISIEIMLRAEDAINAVQSFGAFTVILEFDNYLIEPIDMHMIKPGFPHLWKNRIKKWKSIHINPNQRKVYIGVTYSFYALFLIYTLLKLFII